MDLLEALFVSVDADLVDLLADLILAGALALLAADLVDPAVAFDILLLRLVSVSTEAPDLLLAFFDASTTISSFLLFLAPALEAFVDFEAGAADFVLVTRMFGRPNSAGSFFKRVVSFGSAVRMEEVEV